MRRMFTTLTAASALMLATPAMAANNAAIGKAAEAQLNKAQVEHSDDGEWISLTGTVKSVGDKSFNLGYGRGDIRVEMDEYAWYDKTAVVPGDRVTVTGRMDDGWFEDKTIDASSVYLPRLDTYYYSNTGNEDFGFYSHPIDTYTRDGKAEDDAWVAFSGTVASIDDEDLMLDTGSRQIKIDTETMERSPIDDDGPQTVHVGDRISVTGEMDDADLFDTREVLASSIVVLRTNENKSEK